MYPETKQLTYKVLRTLSATDDVAIVWGSGTSGTSDRTEEAGATIEIVDIPQHANAAIVLFHGTHTTPEGKALVWMLIGWREAGPAELIANGTAELGTQRVESGTTSAAYADSITITAQKWLKPVYVIDHGNNRIAKLAFDMCGISHIACVIQKNTTTSAGAKVSFF